MWTNHTVEKLDMQSLDGQTCIVVYTYKLQNTTMGTEYEYMQTGVKSNIVIFLIDAKM